MTHNEYTKLPGINVHGLMKILKAPALFKWEFTNPSEPSAAQNFGSIFHLAVLEPVRFAKEVVTAPDCDKRSKEYKSFLEDHSAATIIGYHDRFKLDGMLDSVHRNSTISRLLAKAPEREVSRQWEIDEIPCKGRVDAIGDDFIVDIKTTRDASLDSFSRDAAQYNYDMQAAFYVDGFAKKGRSFVFVCIETEAPYLTAIYIVSPRMLESGRTKYRRALEIYKTCVETGHWQGYGEQPQILDLPEWAYRKTEANA